MADQLNLAIQTTGDQAALSALQSVKAAYEAVLGAVQQGAGAQQAAAQTTAQAAQTTAQAHQQAAQVIAAAEQQAAQSVAAAQQQIINSESLSAQQRAQLRQQLGQRLEQIELQAAQAVERAAMQGATAVERAGLQQAQAQERAAAAAVQAAERQAQAAQSAGTAYLSLGTVLGNLPGPIGQLGNAFAGLTVEVEKSNLAALGVAGAFGAAAAGVAGALGSAVHEAAGYESAMAQVQVTSHASAAEMRQFSDAAMDLGARSAFTSTEVAKGFYELSGAGLTVAESLKAIEPITQLAMLGNQQLGETTANVVGVMRQFGMEADQVGHIVNVEALAVQGSMLHWNELGEVYKNLAGRAHTMGTGLEEVTAALMVTRNAGLDAAMAGTALGTFYDRLAKQKGEAAAGAKELGLQLYNEQGQFVGLTSVLEQVAAKTQGWTEQQINHAESLLTGARASGFLRNALAAQQAVEIDGQQVTLHGVEVLKYWTEQLKNANNTVNEQAQIIFATWTVQMKMLTSSVQESSIIIGRQFLPALEQITPALTNAVNLFIKAPDSVHEMAAAFLVLETGALAATAAVGLIAVAGDALIPILGGVAVALGTAAPPLLVLTAASATLAVAWANDWGGIREITASTISDVRQELADLTADLGHVGTGLAHGFSTIGGDFSGLGALINAELRSALAGAGVDTSALTDLGNQAGVALGEGIKHGLLTALPGGSLAVIIAAALHGAAEIGTLSDPSILPDISTQMAAITKKWGADLAAGAPDIMAQFRVALKAQFDQGIVTNESLDAATAQLQVDLENRFGHDVPVPVIRALAQGMLQEVQSSQLGGHVSEAIANQIGNGQDAVTDAVKRLLDGAKQNVGKALSEAVTEGNQLAAESLIKIETGTKAVEAAVKGADAAWQAQVLTMLHAQDGTDRLAGVQQTLTFLYESGAISLQKYQDGMAGITEGTKRAATAAQEHQQHIRDLIGSTDAASVSQGLYEQQLDKLIDQEAKRLPAIEGQVLALQNSNQTMQAANLVAQALGISTQTLIDASHGDAAALEQVRMAEGQVKTAKQERAAAQAQLSDLIAAGAEKEVAAMLREQAMHADIQKAIQGTSAAYQAHILVIEKRDGAQAALNQMQADGVLSERQAQAAADGTKLAHDRVTTALQQRQEETRRLLQSADEAEVAQGLERQGLDQLVDKYAKLLPEMQAHLQALVNQGHADLAAADLAARLGVDLGTLTEAASGNKLAMDQLDVATGKVAASHEHATTAAQAHKHSLQDLMASTDAATVAEGLYAQQIDKVTNQALNGMDQATKAVVLSLKNAGDQIAANKAIADYYNVDIGVIIGALNGQKKAELDLADAIKIKQKAEEDAAKGIPSVGLRMSEGLFKTTFSADQMRQAGQQAGAGLAQGFQSAQSLVEGAARDVANAGSGGVRAALQIQSPSALWASYGQLAVAGLQGGILGAMDGFTSTVTSALSGAANAAGGAFNSGLADLGQAAVEDAAKAFDKPGTVGFPTLANLDATLEKGVADPLTTKMDRIGQALYDQGQANDAVLKAVGAYVTGPWTAPPIEPPGLPGTPERVLPIPDDQLSYFSPGGIGGLGRATGGIPGGLTALLGLGDALNQPVGQTPGGGAGGGADWGYGTSPSDPLGIHQYDAHQGITGYPMTYSPEQVAAANARARAAFDRSFNYHPTEADFQAAAQLQLDRYFQTGAPTDRMKTTAQATLDDPANQWMYAAPFAAGAGGDPYKILQAAQRDAATKNPTSLLYGARWGPLPGDQQVGLYQQSAGSLLQSLLGQVPLGLRAQYQAMVAQNGGDPTAALSAFWQGGGGNMASLENLIMGNKEGIYGAAGSSGSYTVGHDQYGGSGIGASGGGITATAGEQTRATVQVGSGLATHGYTFDTSGMDASQIAAYIEDVKRNWAIAEAGAKALGDNTPLVALAWSSIKDLSDTVKTSVASVAGAFSAYAMDLNTKGLSSITGAWTQGTIGAPSGPLGTGAVGVPSGDPGELLRQAALNISGFAQNTGQTLQDAATQWTALSTQAGDTQGALRAAQVAQNAATSEVRQLTGQLQFAGDNAAVAAAVQQQLTAAQQHLTDTTTALSNVQGTAASAANALSTTATLGNGLYPGPGNTGPSATGYSTAPIGAMTPEQAAQWWNQYYGNNHYDLINGVLYPKPTGNSSGSSAISTTASSTTTTTNTLVRSGTGSSGDVSVTVPDGVSYNDYIASLAPHLDSGGYVVQTGLAVVHRGETYSGVGGGGAPPQINLTYAPTIAGSTAPEQAEAVNKMLQLLQQEAARRGLTLSRR